MIICPSCGHQYDRDEFRFGLPTEDRHSGTPRAYDRCLGCIGDAVGARAKMRLPYYEEAAQFRTGQGELW